MQKVHGLVAAQSLILVALAMVVWRSGDLAPPSFAAEQTAAAAREGTAPSAHGSLGALPPAAGSPGPTDRTAALPSANAAAAAVVLHGSLLGIDPPPKDDNVRMSCRRDAEWRSATVDDAGHFAIAGLLPGAWRLSCEVEGCRKIETELELTSAPVQHRDFTLTAATVLPVFVKTSTGGRLQTAIAKAGMWTSLQVIATAAPLTGDLPATENSLVGDLGLGRHRRSSDLNANADEQASDGVLELDQPPPVFAALLFSHVVLAQQRVEPGQHELHFQVDFAAVQSRLAKVRFRVVDEAGQPLAKVMVELETAQGGGGRQSTAADGTATLKDVVPGLLQLGLRSKDRENVTNHVFVGAGADLDLGDLVLRPSRNVHGVVKDATGQPQAASVQWTDLGLWRAPQPMIDRRNSSADGDGNFQLYGLGPKRYSVRARTDDGRVGFAIVDAASLGTAPFPIVVAATTAVQFQAPADDLRTYRIIARDRDGAPLAVCTIEPRWRQGALNLPPGQYRLDIYSDERTLLRSQDLVVGTTPLRLELP